MLIHAVDRNDVGYPVGQGMFAYDVQFSDKPPDAKWRRSHRSLVVCESIEEAIQMIKSQYQHDPVIVQIVLRNNNMEVLLTEKAFWSSPKR